MTIALTRDSVCAGDDVDAPNAGQLTVRPEASLVEVLEQVKRARYLAEIKGGKATWVVVGDLPLAVVAEQWDEPQLLPAGEALQRVPSKLHFRYYMQRDPNEVVAQFRRT